MLLAVAGCAVPRPDVASLAPQAAAVSLALEAAATSKVAPKLINVGLVSTGTRSFAAAAQGVGLKVLHGVRALGHRSSEVTFVPLLSKANLSLSDEQSALASELADYDGATDIPFLAPEVIEQAESLSQDSFVFVATNRSREAWLTSMLQHPEKGWTAFRALYNLNVSTVGECAAVGWASSCLDRSGSPLVDFSREELETAYDRHQRLLLQYQIPTISIEDPDSSKWEVLCGALGKPQSAQWQGWARLCRSQSAVTPWPHSALRRESDAAERAR